MVGPTADPKKDGIPLFLQTQNITPVTPEQRAKVDTWLRARPQPTMASAQPTASATAAELIEQRAAKKAAKDSNRIARLTNSIKLREIPEKNRVWDHRHNRWIDGVEDARRRLQAARARLGITEENDQMTKLTIQTYLAAATFNDQVKSDRGRTSVPQDAQPFEIQAQVRKIMFRVGVNKVGRVEVHSPEGQVIETWTPNDDRSLMVSDKGPSFEVGPEPEPSGEDDMATKSKRKTTKAKTTKAKKNGKADGANTKPGVIAEIINFTSRAKGATVAEMVEHLKGKFPGRPLDGMEATCRIQVSRQKFKRDAERNENRGGYVYHAKG